jgi:precorrin-6A/cobalt-precorrin-6A reductase
VAAALGIPCFHFVRPPVIAPDEPGVEFVPDHPAAARLAFAHGQPVLLTTGSNHLLPYADESRRTGLPLVVRVLGNWQLVDACQAAGLSEDRILTGRGPFSIEENLSHIRQFGVGVLVTKDSGRAGGTLEKLAAARLESCRIVVVQRPGGLGENVFADINALIKAVCRTEFIPFSKSCKTE